MDFDEYPVIDRLKTGHTLKRIMQQYGMTARDVQEYLNLACVQSVYRWMTGISIPTIDNLYALSQLFHLPIDSFVCGSRHIRKDVQMITKEEYVAKWEKESLKDRRRLKAEGYSDLYIESYIRGVFIGYHQGIALYVKSGETSAEEVADLLYMDVEEFKEKDVLTNE